MWIFAVVIALSRVVITAHYVSDVTAAGFVGAFGAILVRNWFAARRLGFVAQPDGAVHTLPGPSWRRLKAVARRLLCP
jgi:membrane-associated phospholipid phosphatase